MKCAQTLVLYSSSRHTVSVLFSLNNRKIVRTVVFLFFFTSTDKWLLLRLVHLGERPVLLLFSMVPVSIFLLRNLYMVEQFILGSVAIKLLSSCFRPCSDNVFCFASQLKLPNMHQNKNVYS